MLKLVSQFDTMVKRPTVSTPTCGGCCCCCCCLATTITTTAVTGMNLHAAGKQNILPPNRVNTVAVLGGLHWILAIAGAVVFSVTGALLFVSKSLNSDLLITYLPVLIIDFLILLAAFKAVAHSNPVIQAFKFAALTAFCFALEFYAGVYILIGLGSPGIVLYIIGVIGISWVFIKNTRELIQKRQNLNQTNV